MNRYSVLTLALIAVFACTLPLVAFPPPGGPGAQTWTIDSPGENAQFNWNSAVSCSGKAIDDGIDWECRIRQNLPSGGFKQSSVSGTSVSGTPDTWSGTVSAPSGGWSPETSGNPPVDATVTLKDLDLDEDVADVTISFKHD